MPDSLCAEVQPGRLAPFFRPVGETRAVSGWVPSRFRYQSSLAYWLVIAMPLALKVTASSSAWTPSKPSMGPAPDSTDGMP
ncbi:hypothetical protein D3C71_1159030 [compost metagenome]